MCLISGAQRKSRLSQAVEKCMDGVFQHPVREAEPMPDPKHRNHIRIQFASGPARCRCFEAYQPTHRYAIVCPARRDIQSASENPRTHSRVAVQHEASM